MARPGLILASASPRRRSLLEALGVVLAVDAPKVDESPLPDERPRDHVVRLAEAKAAQVRARHEGAPSLILAADTTVAADGRIFGKPGDGGEALAMLRALAGREHEVVTACRLVDASAAAAATRTATTVVRFAPWSEAAARWYVGTGEPEDKAGAYGIQGYGVFLTRGIAGSWSNVVGLPLELLPELFAAVGDDLFARLAQAGRSVDGMEGGGSG